MKVSFIKQTSNTTIIEIKSAFITSNSAIKISHYNPILKLYSINVIFDKLLIIHDVYAKCQFRVIKRLFNIMNIKLN